MAVIINDFEIAVEAPPPAAPAEGEEGPEAGAAEGPATPERIVAVMRWDEERRSRVDAT